MDIGNRMYEEIAESLDRTGTLMVSKGSAIPENGALPDDLQYLAKKLNPSVLRSLRITSALQVTLDLEKLLRLFSKELSAYVQHKSLAYENRSARISLELGEKASYSCQYELVVSQKNIGSITITRAQSFDDRSIREFEALLCGLIYPLLNALMFRDALESAHRDPLTQTLNRSAMLTYTNREIDLARRQNTPLSLLLIDLDNFKSINDRCGHTAGDAVIQQIAQRFLHCIRKCDLLFRYGGDEFTVLMSNSDVDQAVTVVRRLLDCVRDPVIADDPAAVDGGDDFRITASIGVAVLEPEDTYETLIQRADGAMYRAKTTGGDKFEVAVRDRAI